MHVFVHHSKQILIIDRLIRRINRAHRCLSLSLSSLILMTDKFDEKKEENKRDTEKKEDDTSVSLSLSFVVRTSNKKNITGRLDVFVLPK